MVDIIIMDGLKKLLFAILFVLRSLTFTTNHGRIAFRL